MKKYLLIGLGSIFVALGFIGIFIPLLPTTPFLLLAAFCFLHSSPRLHHWLMHHKVFGPFISNYIKHRAISRWTKMFSISLLWITITFSILFVESHQLVKLALLIIAIGVSIHILSLKTLSTTQKR